MEPRVDIQKRDIQKKISRRKFLKIAAGTLAGGALGVLGSVLIPNNKGKSSALETPIPPQPTKAPTAIPTAQPAPVMIDRPTAIPIEAPVNSEPERWREWPVVPERISQKMKDVRKKGLRMNRNPRAIGELGDCQSAARLFWGNFDNGAYKLAEGPDKNALQLTIDKFHGNWMGDGVADRSGLNVSGVQSSLWNISPLQIQGESPLETEIRLRNPSFMFVTFEQKLANLDQFRKSYESVINKLLDAGIVPIVAMTAQNEEENRVIADLANELEFPVVNLWGGIQDLPNHGIVLPSEDPSGFHLSQRGGDLNFDFSVPREEWTGWLAKNDAALRAMEAVDRMINQ